MKPKIKRNKAFIGAAIGAATSLINTGINLYQQNKQAVAEIEAQREAEINENNQKALQSAQNLTNAYADQSYVNSVKDRVVFRAGGKLNLRGYDRIEVMKMGGRKRRKC